MANIPTHLLGYIRNQVSNFLTDTCTIQSTLSSVSASGRPTNNKTEVATGVSCRVMTSTSGSRNDAELLGDRQIVGQRYSILLPYGQEIKTGYWIITGGETYNVVSIETKLTDNAFVKVLAVKP